MNHFPASRFQLVRRIATLAGLLVAMTFNAPAAEVAATAKSLRRAVADGSFGKWSAAKRHLSEQALLERISDEPESREAMQLAAPLQLDSHRGELIPSLEHPLILTDPLQRLRYFVNHALEAERAAEDSHFVAPAAKFFPGAVDSSVPRESALTVTITPRTGRQGLWEEDETYFRPHPTGCYAAPGEIVTISIPQAWVGKAQVMIGIHGDAPVMSGDFDEPGLRREGFDLTATRDISAVETIISSPYGGPIFLCLPNMDKTEPAFEVTLGGVARAPRFKSGVTTLEEWRASIRARPVPWAELESDNLLISLPSARIRVLDDPKAVLDFWDEVLAAQAELACLPGKRKVIEHLVIDREVESGYMYCVPGRVVAPDDESCELMLDVAKLRKEGSWGHFHELGHRHQFADIDFSGTEEVTVNLFTLYAYHKVLHQDHYVCRREDDWTRETVTANIHKYLAKPSFKTWQDDPFLALSFFVPILDEFGWDPILRLYQGYRATPRDRYPASEAAKRDFFYQHLSRAVGRDLAGYFERWAIPVRKSALIPAAEGLKPWAPAGWLVAAPLRK